MTRYIALLRAINVGGHTVKMDRLRALFTEFGFTQVETFIASGNVIFDSPEEPAVLEEQIGAKLKAALGYEVGTFLRTTQEIAAVASTVPFGGDEGRMIYVIFMAEPPSEAGAARLTALQNENNLFRVIGREVYWLCRTSTLESGIPDSEFRRALSAPGTMRNMNTVRRLAAKYPA